MVNKYNMDLRQKKLTKKEWEMLEIPVPQDELAILKLIRDGYSNLNICRNAVQSLLGFMKISRDLELFHAYLYIRYYEPIFNKLQKKYKFIKYTVKSKKIKLKKADIIRIDNSNSRLDTDKIFEFILLRLLGKFLKYYKRKKGSRHLYYYTLIHLMKNKIVNINTHVITYINNILKEYCNHADIVHFIKHAYEYIEKNPYLSKYKDFQLYNHQKRLFALCKDPNPKLVLYMAPTGTGKTISPIGLAENHKLIFVCAAKHIGLQFAKACISMHIPIAIAFGCNDAGDIKLHYFSVKEYIKNRRTGGYFRVDNTIGDKVQIMISDVQSYLPAMRYMLAFNEREKIIWYWDEPTITLDYETHEFHDIISNNWKENVIPNIILSSATLPLQEEIIPCIQSFKLKFIDGNIYDIVSHECKKTIPLIDNNGYVILPHYIFDTFDDLFASVQHIKKYKTILRHFDLREIVEFILYINKNQYIKRRYQIDNYFDKIKDISVIELKNYYLVLLENIREHYETIYQHLKDNRKKRMESNIYVTTKDSHTLTDGPTIFLCNNVEKIARFCLQSANIPQEILDTILENININDKIKRQIELCEKQINNHEKNDDGKEKKDKRDPKKKAKKDMISGLYSKLKRIELDSVYVPNSFSHIRKWTGDEETQNAFTSSIDEDIVEKIMLLRVENIWKILLMMGIGVFRLHDCIDYVEIMKKLAQEQKLYLIIASTDYIYGTNYQFCHGYLSKDLADLTQEKMIQAFGRIGRSNAQNDYSIRLRDDSFIRKLLCKIDNKREVMNMNRLFGI